MKKLILFAAAAMALSMGSCAGSGTSNPEPGMDSLFSAARADSLAAAFGEALGLDVNREALGRLQADSTFSKSEVLKGIQYILAGDTTTSYSLGMNVGMFLGQRIKQMETLGVNINRTIVFDNFRKAFMKDSVSEDAFRAVSAELTSLSSELNAAHQALEKAKLDKSKESLENIARGRAYLDSVAAADPEVKIGASGVAVKIINEGDDQKLADETRAEMLYTAKTIDGRVIEKTEDPRQVYVSSRPAGFREGLHKLGKGGKAVIYVPGAEAYGVEDSRTRFGLGPNEMVIYEVEVLDITNKQFRQD